MLLGFCAVLLVNTEVDLKSTKKYQHDTPAIEPMQSLPYLLYSDEGVPSLPEL